MKFEGGLLAYFDKKKKLHKSLLKDFNMVLREEELLWALKSHFNWIINEEHNTSFSIFQSWFVEILIELLD